MCFYLFQYHSGLSLYNTIYTNSGKLQITYKHTKNRRKLTQITTLTHSDRQDFIHKTAKNPKG